jgi:hypothetical protein
MEMQNRRGEIMHLLNAAYATPANTLCAHDICTIQKLGSSSRRGRTIEEQDTIQSLCA